MKRLLSTLTILMLAACSPTGPGGTTPPPPGTIDLTTALQGIQSIATLAPQLFAQLQAAGLKANADTSAKVQAIIDGIQKAAAAVTPLSTATQGQDVLHTVEAYLNQLLPLVQPYLILIPPPYGGIVSLVVAAIPAIEVGLNLADTWLTANTKVLAATPPTATPTAAAALTPSQALYLLIAKAHGQA